jgi:4-hydroxy-tetrahydrodipicolinate synthase
MSDYLGVHVALATAMNADCSLNLDATAALADDLIDRGVHGIVVNGSTGEFASLTVDERHRILEAVIEVADERVPVTAQIGAMSTGEAVAHAEHAQATGATAGMLICPYYEPLTEREVEEYFAAVAQVGLPLMIYNNPTATGWSMAPSLIARLSEIDEVRYVKDTTGDISRIFQITELCEDRIQILNGQDSVALAGFLVGARATVWGAPNATPEACVRLWELTVASLDLDAARVLWAALFPAMWFFEESGYSAAVKAATKLRGLDLGPPRHPVLPMEPGRIEELGRLLERLESTLAGLSATRA